MFVLYPAAPLILIMLFSQVANGILLPFVLVFMLAGQRPGADGRIRQFENLQRDRLGDDSRHDRLTVLLVILTLSPAFRGCSGATVSSEGRFGGDGVYILLRRRREAGGRSRSTTSSTVTTPRRQFSSSTTGRARRLYLEISSATFSWLASARMVISFVCITSPSVFAVLQDEIAQADDPQQLFVLHDVNVIDRLDLAASCGTATVSFTVIPGGYARYSFVMSPPRCRPRAPAVRGCPRVLLFDQLEDLLGLFERKVRDHVRRLVRGHAFDDVCGLLLVHVGDEVGLHLRLEFVERLGGRLEVEFPEEPFPLVRGEPADDLREVRRVDFREGPPGTARVSRSSFS